MRVLRELPRERDTLLLRLMGAGAVLRDATADLLALPEDAWEREVALPLLIALRFEIPQDFSGEDERELLMSTTDLYEHWKDHYKSEGVKQSLRMVYKARFAAMSDETAAAIEATHDVAILNRWLDLIATSTPDEILRTIRATASS
ncbi:MAG: hypothetical protein QM820_38435 [Minicystis sp.]